MKSHRSSVAAAVLAFAALCLGAPAHAAPSAPASAAASAGLLFAVSEGTSGGGSAVTDPMLTIQPAPCAFMCGIAALASWNGARR